LAFEETDGLNSLALRMAKDPSVVSRGLLQLAETCPVLQKTKNRWELTALGTQVCSQTRTYLNDLRLTLSNEVKGTKKYFDDPKALLVIINAQNALLAGHKKHSNPLAEANIESLLQLWRNKNKPLLHVQHISNNPESTFYKNSEHAKFIPKLEPNSSEPIIQKLKSSAFFETNLNEYLQKNEITTVILTGFTANECIDATAKDANSMGLNTYVVGDATSMFDLTDPTGKNLKAERIHNLVLANINALYAQVLTTQELLSLS